jgi:hypothetical protein
MSPTFKKYAFGFPSGSIAFIRPVIVHAELPYFTAERTRVPSGMAETQCQMQNQQMSWPDIPSITASSIGKLPSMPSKPCLGASPFPSSSVKIAVDMIRDVNMRFQNAWRLLSAAKPVLCCCGNPASRFAKSRATPESDVHVRCRHTWVSPALCLGQWLAATTR